MDILSPPNRFPTVKNYWFFHGNDGPFQFVLAFGTTVNYMQGKGLTGTYPNYGVLLWGHHPKLGKVVKMETSTKLSFPFESDLFSLKQEGNNFVFEHDDTSLVFGDQYAQGFDGHFLKSSRFNNQFRETKGKVFGKKFKGRSYIQKVEVASPFSSWDWLRFHSKHRGEGYQIMHVKKPVLYFNETKYPISITNKDGVMNLSGEEVDLQTEPYSDYTVVFKGLGRFRYTEFLVKINGKVNGQKVKDYGIVEEARGFII